MAGVTRRPRQANNAADFCVCRHNRLLVRRRRVVGGDVGAIVGFGLVAIDRWTLIGLAFTSWLLWRLRSGMGSANDDGSGRWVMSRVVDAIEELWANAEMFVAVDTTTGISADGC